MKKGASNGQTRQPAKATRPKPNILVPASPYSFEETVARMLKVKPPAKKADRRSKK